MGTVPELKDDNSTPLYKVEVIEDIPLVEKESIGEDGKPTNYINGGMKAKITDLQTKETTVQETSNYQELKEKAEKQGKN